jgi:hypothetical protein
VSELPAVPRGRVLLDENLDRRLAVELPAHDVTTVVAAGWAGLKNGELLGRVEGEGFEVFVTADRNLEYQQTLAGRGFGVVVVFPKRLKLTYLVLLASELRTAVASVHSGEVVHVHPPA